MSDSATPPLPDSTDVLVVGGGLTGTALAYFLAGEGVDVVVAERGELNREASGTNAGSFHFQIAIHHLTAFETANVRGRLLEEVRLLRKAARVWETLEHELDGPLDVHVTGGLMVGETDDQFKLLVEKREIEQEAGLETHLLPPAELRTFAPYLADDLTGATFCPGEGHANPLLVVPLFARRAVERGAVVCTHTAVEQIERRDVAGATHFVVRTSAGTITARRIVNAAAAWANDIATLVGLSHAYRADGLHVNVTEARPRLIEPMVQHIGRRLTLKQSSNNTFIIGGGWPARPEQPPRRYSNRWDSAAGNTAVAIRVVPALAGVRVVRTWTGVMPFTDDGAPVVGESSVVPGYYVCLATTGFTLMPLLARMLAEHMASGTPLPPSFSPDRRSSHPAPTPSRGRT